MHNLDISESLHNFSEDEIRFLTKIIRVPTYKIYKVVFWLNILVLLNSSDTSTSINNVLTHNYTQVRDFG